MEDFSANKIYKHTIQGFLYECLRTVEKDPELHSSKKFKFFCFSDIFPSGNYVKGKEKSFIVSSPNAKLIEQLMKGVQAKKEPCIGGHKIRIKNMNKIKLPLRNRFITGSPIVLYKDNQRNLYYSFRRNDDLDFFLQRLKDNIVKKYEAFFGEKLDFEEPLFDKLIFNKEVAVKNVKNEREFIIIGSMWYLLEKVHIKEELKKFYWFLMECGLGEKNSMGFGFVNPLK